MEGSKDIERGPRIVWSDESVPITVEQALRPEAQSAPDGQRAAECLECDHWLQTFLAAGHKSTIEVFKAGAAAGFSKNQIRRAKHRTGVEARKEGFAHDGRWTWGLFAARDPHVPRSAERPVPT
jgi:hypothetical protein